MSKPSGDPAPAKDPGYKQVYDYLLFGMSLPERTLRTMSGMAAGALRESTALLVPQAFRNAKTYNIFIQQLLDFVAEDVGGVERPDDPEAAPKTDLERVDEDW